MPEKVNRHAENIEERYYLRRGYTLDEARAKMKESKKMLARFKAQG